MYWHAGLRHAQDPNGTSHLHLQGGEAYQLTDWTCDPPDSAIKAFTPRALSHRNVIVKNNIHI
jgi:hypothetical protein